MWYTQINRKIIPNFLLLFSLHQTTFSQNLIPNPSFEKFEPCPIIPVTDDYPIDIESWYSPTKGTPDLFSICSQGGMSVPKNILGYSQAADGDSYLGLYLGAPNEKENKYYREYLTCRLLDNLNLGEKYLLSFKFRAADYSLNTIKRITFALTEDSIFYSNSEILGQFAYEEVFVDSLAMVEQWKQLHFIFIASGKEQFLTIGDLSSPLKSNYTAREIIFKNTVFPCYYLFDDFSLISIPGEEYKIDELFHLDNIYFEFDSYQLSANSIQDLDKLARYLIQNDKLKLKIFGNSDITGEERYNEILALNRAKSVKRKLVALGVKKERIAVKSNGEKVQVSTLDSLNRRTEFILSNE